MQSVMNVSLRHDDDYYETPDWVIKQIENKTHPLILGMDLCASKENTKCGQYMSEDINALEQDIDLFPHDWIIFCNPPRSKNGKFVDFVYNTWVKRNHNIVMLLCWNDLGNKYGEKLIPHILNGDIQVYNLGKVKFFKDNIESKYPSRLTYFWAWFKRK